MGTGVMLGAWSQGTGDEFTAFARWVEELGYGSLWLPELAGREAMETAGWWLASTSTLTRSTSSPRLPASASSAGLSCRQGPHHSAQKSTTTGT